MLKMVCFKSLILNLLQWIQSATRLTLLQIPIIITALYEVGISKSAKETQSLASFFTENKTQQM